MKGKFGLAVFNFCRGGIFLYGLGGIFWSLYILWKAFGGDLPYNFGWALAFAGHSFLIVFIGWAISNICYRAWHSGTVMICMLASQGFLRALSHSDAPRDLSSLWGLIMLPVVFFVGLKIFTFLDIRATILRELDAASRASQENSRREKTVA